jgi:predicted SAM-dependent methyltransferase
MMSRLRSGIRTAQGPLLTGGAIAIVVAANTLLAKRLAQMVGRVEERLGLTRNEMLFEMRYGTSGGGTSSEIPAAVILNDDKLRQARDNIKLNIGAGDKPMKGYLNVDRRELPGIDITADVKALPFEKSEVAEIRAEHLLEHFPVEEVRRAVLPHWVSLLRDGGRLVVTVPDAEAMLDDYHAKTMSFEDLRQVTFGAQDYEGDFHYTMFSVDELSALLKEVGLSEVTVKARAQKNGLCREMTVEGMRL